MNFISFIVKSRKMKAKVIQSFLIICTFLLTSCKQTIFIHEAVLIDEPATKGDLWGFITASLIGGKFCLWLVVDLLIATFLWYKGYHLLEWFKRRRMSQRLVIIVGALIAVFVFGCIPQQHYGFWFALPVALAIGSTIVVGWSVMRRIRFWGTEKENNAPVPEPYRRQSNLMLLAKTMVWIWTCGWVIYFVAIGVAMQPHVGAELLLRSAIASLDLFLMDIDSNILDAIQGHDVLKGMIVCASFAAVICTVILILSLVLSRLMAYLHVQHITVDNKHNHLYVFFGLNDASKLLANDIYANDSHSVIVFVENSQNGENEQGEDQTDSWKNIVNILILRRKTFTDTREDERRALAIASCMVSSLEEDTNDVWGNVGLDTVKKLLKMLAMTNDGELHVFFLSEDRDTNVRSSAIMAKDKLVGCSSYKTIIYCHARRNGVNRVIEDMGLEDEKRTEIRILDSSHLAIEHLKRNVANHPINFVEVQTLKDDNPGTVSSKFVSMVMGFGETGQEAVEFLYEYSAFVDKASTEHDSKRSPFCCHVLDNEMEKLEGHFISGIPAVLCQRSHSTESESILNALIKFYPYDYRSDEFFTKVLDIIAEELNYVIVAIGDDELNMTVAVEILRYVRRKRKNLDNFCIYVRAYEKGTFKHLNEIAKHYNLRLGKNEEDVVKKIILFGQNEQIYTYELVVKDKYQEEGIEYYEAYRSLLIDRSNDEGTWEERHKKNLKSNGKTTKWERMSKIRRKESQDRSNALHAHTKIMLLEKTIEKENARDFAMRALSQREGRKSTIGYPLLTLKENRLMLNLAMCEHLRWNAAHEMLGYVNNEKGHECDELRKMHNCLKPWRELDAEADAINYIDDYKVFDFGVVETSFKLEYDNKDKS